ncbi:MAG: hypothetical protein ACLPUO_11215 [Streptosporangiaceae bacterium]|jgi:hypothetical protein
MAAAEASVLRVHGVDGGAVGVGVLIGSRTAVTCAHVVNAVLGARRARSELRVTSSLRLTFPCSVRRRLESP